MAGRLIGGGPEATVFSNTERMLTLSAASCILDSNLSVTEIPSFKAKEGCFLLLSDKGVSDLKDDWKADGYTWRHNGRRVYNVGNKVIGRHFYKIRNKNKVSSDFQKHVFRYTDKDYSGKTVIVYYGDSNEYKSLPHGNRIRNNRPIKRTQPSVFNEI